MIRLLIECDAEMNPVLTPRFTETRYKLLNPEELVIGSHRTNFPAHHPSIRFSFSESRGYTNFDAMLRTFVDAPNRCTVLGGIRVFESALIFASRITMLVDMSIIDRDARRLKRFNLLDWTTTELPAIDGVRVWEWEKRL